MAGAIRHINLLPPDLAPRRPFPLLALSLGVTAAVAVMTAAYGLYLEARATELRAQSSRLQAQITEGEALLRAAPRPAAPGPATPVQESQALQDLERLRRLHQALNQRGGRGWSAHLEALARAHVDGVWLTEVGLQPGGQAVRLAGGMLHAALLKTYLSRLSAQPEFAGLGFRTLVLHAPGEEAPGAPGAGGDGLPAYYRFVLDAQDHGGQRP